MISLIATCNYLNWTNRQKYSDNFPEHIRNYTDFEMFSKDTYTLFNRVSKIENLK